MEDTNGREPGDANGRESEDTNGREWKRRMNANGRREWKPLIYIFKVLRYSDGVIFFNI